MGMKAMLVVAAMAMVFAGQRARGAEDEGRPAELKVLDRWVGDWDLEITVKPSAQNRQGSKSTFKATNRWGLNNRFLIGESKGEGTSGERKFADAFMWICTHDPQSNAYRSSVSWATVEKGESGNWGLNPVGVGTWDEKEQSLTIRSEDRESGIVTISVTQWIDKDTHRFVQSVTEKNGRVIVEMTGTAKRRK